ncbi:Stringent starvation protein B [Aquicella siphonis]|uniref:Stringent starvation protein B n=1 Tax=Aquicella siphonis TaxID=254247 RepID=A0A5E4PIW9_9COXI|nr:ClpXP protease specificity-enhancing factor [Aquicella siphonis]VVC76363.1 Stringent starvation protein B [Aquicella siphonis]
MLSNRPYLLRAFYQWIVDSNCNPILVVDANNSRAKIPQDYAEGGEIVFNISPTAIRDLKILNDLIEFKASFSGVIHIISAPIKAVLAIYAEENGEGIFFDAEEDGEGDNAVEEMVSLKGIDGTGGVDMGLMEHQAGSGEPATVKSKPILKLVE